MESITVRTSVAGGCGGGGVFLQPLMMVVMSGPGGGVTWES